MAAVLLSGAGHEQEQEDKTSDSGMSRQQEWLFWGGTALALILIVGFFIASFVQLSFLHQKILEGAQTDLRQSVDILSHPAHTTSEQVAAAGRLQSLVTLELYALERRYHQANVLLMSRIWIRYLGFITGMILALMGGAFILGRLREPPSKWSANAGSGKFSFEGTSPGMFLAGLGVILMLFTIVVNHKIDVKDQAVYTQGVLMNVQPKSEPVNKQPPLTIPDFSAPNEAENAK